jgi:hypothetical protein
VKKNEEEKRQVTKDFLSLQQSLQRAETEVREMKERILYLQKTLTFIPPPAVTAATTAANGTNGTR